MLRRVLEEELVDYVAMDIKNSPAKYAETSGFRYFSVEDSSSDDPMDDPAPVHTGAIARLPGISHAEDLTDRVLDLGKIKESISLLINGTVDYEFRTTVVKEFHSSEDFFEIGEMIRGADRYFLQCFKDSGDIIGMDYTACSEEEMKHFLAIVRETIPGAQIRGMD